MEKFIIDHGIKVPERKGFESKRCFHKRRAQFEIEVLEVINSYNKLKEYVLWAQNYEKSLELERPIEVSMPKICFDSLEMAKLQLEKEISFFKPGGDIYKKIREELAMEIRNIYENIISNIPEGKTIVECKSSYTPVFPENMEEYEQLKRNIVFPNDMARLNCCGFIEWIAFQKDIPEERLKSIIEDTSLSIAKLFQVTYY